MAKRNIDPSNSEEFTRPVTLQRRDPKQQVPGRKEEEEPVEDVLDSKEREKQEILKAEKERQRAEDMAQMAPSAKDSAARKKNKGARIEKTSKVAKVDLTEEQQKASNIRYEEARPWHLEDADNKNTWVGNYEAALSKVNAMFVIDGHCFRMIPVEKWYKFTAKANFKTFTIEEAEEQLKKKIKESRWVMKTDEQRQAEQDAKDYYRMTSMYTVKGESETFKSSAKGQKEEIDDLDFEALFDDDDEQPGLEADDNDSEKEAKNKIKKEQLGSNLFGDGDEREVDREAAEVRREKELLKKQGKGTKKALKWRERNFNYASDSEDHPYSSRVSVQLGCSQWLLILGRVKMILLMKRSKRRLIGGKMRSTRQR
jgi:transcription initiation factor TFIIF subunit alpha